jgi:hypothetical protein
MLAKARVLALGLTMRRRLGVVRLTFVAFILLVFGSFNLKSGGNLHSSLNFG